MKLLRDVDTTVRLYEMTLQEFVDRLGLKLMSKEGRLVDPSIDNVTIINAQTQRDLLIMEQQRVLIRVTQFVADHEVGKVRER